MNELGNKYALAALKDKRAALAGEITQLKKQIAWRQEQLAHVDATLLLFDPKADPDRIPAKRAYKHVKLFKQGELGRTILDALRQAGGPTSTADLATAVTAAIGQPQSMRAAMVHRARANLAYLERRGTVVKTGAKGAVRWALAEKGLAFLRARRIQGRLCMWCEEDLRVTLPRPLSAAVTGCSLDISGIRMLGGLATLPHVHKSGKSEIRSPA